MRRTENWHAKKRCKAWNRETVKEQNAGLTYRKHRQQLKICPSSGRCFYLYSMKVWKPLLKTAVYSFPLKELRRLHPSPTMREGDEPAQVSYKKGADSVVQLSDERAAVNNPRHSMEQQLLTGPISRHAPHLRCSWQCQCHCVMPPRLEQHLESGEPLL